MSSLTPRQLKAKRTKKKSLKRLSDFLVKKDLTRSLLMKLYD